MKKNNLSNNDILKGVKKPLNQQTDTILNATDERISSLATKVDLVNLEIKINKKLEAMEERWNSKFDKLTTTLETTR